ncbi:MAG: SLATT domain-containing protein [Candidatus Nanopelagicaceae bacterium]|nr:SLATT domain-containing protein [Candidatus Nanopelagicaceae bacterium]
MSELENLYRRSYKTYKGRLEAGKRLALCNHLWNGSLVALSTAMVVASVGMIADEKIYGPRGPIYLIALSIAHLTSSLTVLNLKFGARSRDMFMNYRRIQRVSVEAENLRLEKRPSKAMIRNLSDQYQMLLDESENHSVRDYEKAFIAEKKGWKTFTLKYFVPSSMLIPIVFYAVSIMILCPFVVWSVSAR